MGVDVCALGDVVGELADRPAELAHRLPRLHRPQRDLVAVRYVLGQDQGSPAGFDAASGLQCAHRHRHVVPGVEVEERARFSVAVDEFGLRHLVTGVK